MRAQARAWSALRRSDPATAQLLSALVGIVVIGVVFGTVIDISYQRSSDSTEMEVRAGLQVASANLARTILGGPGVGWYPQGFACLGGLPTDAGLAPDAVRRFGLGIERCAGQPSPTSDNVSYYKVRDLNAAAYDADPANGHLDYVEARRSLGLEPGGPQFHVRAWPVLAEVREILRTGHRDPYQRVAYVGAYESLTGQGSSLVYDVERSCGKTDAAASVEVWVDVTNNGTAATAFEVAFSVPLAAGTVELARHTGVVMPLATVRAAATLPKSADWAWAGAAAVGVTVSDPARLLGGCSVSLAGVVMTSASANRIHSVQAQQLQETLAGGSATPKVYYDAFDGQGQRTTEAGWTLEVVSSLGVPLASDANLASRGWESFTLVVADTAEVRLKSAAGLVLAVDAINVVASPIGEFSPLGGAASYVPEPSVVPEISYVRTLVEPFTANVYAPTYASPAVPHAPGGDVFPDLKAVMNGDLADRLMDDRGTADPGDDVATLAEYNLLVVGSNVDHNAMTSAAAKQTIRDWVYAGGYLLVLGSAQQAVQWLEPIFHSAIASASGGLSTPDPSHPVLRVPNRLDHATYDAHGNAWRYTRPADADHFTHVVLQGSDDLLAVSEPGAFGQGRVLLTAYTPFDLGGQGASGPCDPAAVQADCAALQALQNFFTIAYRELYLDYGPPVPTGADVAVSTGVANLHHPDLGASVQVVVQVYVF